MSKAKPYDNGFEAKSAKRPAGWVGLPNGTRMCLSCGSSASNRRLDGRSRMRREFHVRFSEGLGVRFPGATYLVIHCMSEKQAKYILEAVRRRLGECGLELHPEKTQIVYCQDDDRPGKYERIKFDFLDYTFRPRRAKNRYGKYFVSFLPAISTKSANKIRATIRGWRIAAIRNNQSLEDLARLCDP